MSELLRKHSLSDVDAVLISHLHADHCVDVLAAYTLLSAHGHSGLPVYGPAGWAGRMDAFLDVPGAMSAVFTVRELFDGLQMVFGGLAVEAFLTEHNAETYGFRAAAGSAVAAYSGDSGPCEAVERLAAKADLFLCEAGAERAGTKVHLTPEEAGEAAARGAAKRLIGPVEIAAKGRVVTVGAAT